MNYGVMFRSGSEGVGGSGDGESERPRRKHCRLVLVYNDHNEWPLERRIVWNEVLPELQSFAFHNGIDLEMVDILTDVTTLGWKTHKNVHRTLDDSNTLLMVMVGDKYGASGPPSELRKEEFDALKQAVFEQDSDVKLLDQYYVLDRTRTPEEYRLKMDVDDPKISKTLLRMTRKGAETAFEEGTINQVAPHRQQRFFWSYLHNIVARGIQLDTNRFCAVLRKFDGAKADKPNEPWVDNKSADLKKVQALKNEISSDSENHKVLSFCLPVENGEVKKFFSGKEVEKYRDEFGRKALECLKTSITSMFPKIPASIQGPSLLNVIANEDASHIAHLKTLLPRTWINRKSLDAKIKELTKEIFPGMFLIQGPELCGKTQTLVRLYELTEEKTAYRIIRFAGLSYSSTFAHEMWRTISFTLSMQAGRDPTPLLSIFKLADLMSFLTNLLDKLDRPLFLFIDDIHLLKHGRLLSQLERRPATAPSNLVLFVCASNTVSIPNVFLTSQTINLEAPTEGEICEIVKKSGSKSNFKISNDQLAVVKQQLTGNEKNVVVGIMLMDEIRLRGNGVMRGGIEGRLERIEAQFGQLPVQTACRYLCVSSHGLTRLELSDILSSNKQLLSALGGVVAFPPFLLDDILEALGNLLMRIIIDNREVFRFAHQYILNAVRHRYLTSTADLKGAHGDLADVFADMMSDVDAISPRAPLQYQVFPQSLKRDNGEVNLRKVRNLWFHLLHTGNMDALKELSLCNFDYMDCVVRSCGIAHLLSMYEECVLQVLHHDIQVLCEQVLLPALDTVVRDNEQLAAEVIGRLRYTRAENSHFLNTMVEQAMAWVDTYSKQPLLVPLTCWIPPPQMKQVLSFKLKEWKANQTVLTPTHNHQHVLIAGNENAPGLVYMYHIASQYLITTFKGHEAAVTSLCTSNDGSFFVSTSLDKTVRIWNFTNGECTQSLTPHKSKVMCSLLSNDDELLITGSADSCAKVIQVSTGKVLKSFGEHTGSVTSLQLTSNNQLLITGSGDFVVQIWDMQSGKLVNRMGGLMAPVTCVAITSNDAFVAVACEDETLRIFGTVSAQELHELSGHESKVNSLACANDDCQLYAGTLGRIYCYDLHTGQVVDTLQCDTKNQVTSLKITSDNYFLISGCGSSVNVWNVRERIHDSVDAMQADEEGYVTAIAMSPDEKIAACGTFNGIVALWDLDICQCITTVVQAKNVPITSLVFTYDSSCLLSGNELGMIIVTDSAHGHILRRTSFHNAPVMSISCLENGTVVSCDKSGNLKVWEMVGEENELEEMSASGVVPPIFVTPSARILIGHVPNTKKEMKIWMLSDTTATVKNRVHHNEEISCFAATALGSLVVTGSTDQSLKIWQIDSGFLTQVLVGHEDIVTCCALSEDEHIVVSGARDQKVIFWSVQTGDVLRQVQTTSPVSAVCISADSSVAFSADEQGWIEAWSVSKGQLLSSFNAHRPIKNILRSFDANRLLVHLESCAQLAILCLHNTPAGPHLRTERRRSARAHSLTSIGSNASESKKDSTAAAQAPPSGNGTPASATGNTIAPPRPTFDKLERSKSRSSLVEKDRSTSLPPAPVTASTQKSHLCVLL